MKKPKKPEASDIVSLHAVSTLPDSLEGRRKILRALLAACPGSRYTERISVMLEHLEQHQACLESSTRLPPAGGRPELKGEGPKPHFTSKSQTQNSMYHE